MRILYIADGRSPIATNWIRYFAESEHEIHLISTFNCRPEMDLASFQTVSVAFSGAKGNVPSRRSRIGVASRTKLRQWLGPFTVRRAARQVREQIEALQPDLIHAMRIPFEGMAAATADPKAPLLVSVWGNDFTLHARSSLFMRRLTRLAVTRATGLHVDCHRDLHLARLFGLRPDSETIVLPGGGGVRADVFYPAEGGYLDEISPVFKEVPRGVPLVVNPRGIRAYIRNDTFFKSIPTILQTYPNARFCCPDMAGHPMAQAHLDRLGIGNSVHLLPKLSPVEMGQLFRMAQVVISLSEHDGTPNTLLEAMASGCFPIAGDLASIREWIESGENGILLDAGDPQAVSSAVVEALSRDKLRADAASRNARMIEDRATYTKVMDAADAFYSRIAQTGE